MGNADLFWYWSLVEAYARAERFPAEVPSADVGKWLEAPMGTVYGETYAALESTSLQKREERRYSIASEGTTITMIEKNSEQSWNWDHRAQGPMGQSKPTWTARKMRNLAILKFVDASAEKCIAINHIPHSCSQLLSSARAGCQTPQKVSEPRPSRTLRRSLAGDGISEGLLRGNA